MLTSECGWKGGDRNTLGRRKLAKGEHPCLPSSEPCYGWLVGPSRLRMNSLRSALTARLTSQKNTYPDKGKHGHELAQPQNALTSAGLLMEGQCALSDPALLQTRFGDNAPSVPILHRIAPLSSRCPHLPMTFGRRITLQQPLWTDARPDN